MDDLDKLRMDAGLSRLEVIALFGITERTWQRWCKTGNPKPFVTRYLQMAAGHLGAINPVWSGWRIRRDQIFTPDYVEGIPQTEITAIPLRIQEKDAYKARSMKLDRELAVAEDVLHADPQPQKITLEIKVITDDGRDASSRPSLRDLQKLNETPF